MSTIYSAGQFDDAFSPKRLGNWESGAKEAYPFVKMSTQLRGRGTKTEIIVNSRGHLLPGVPRDRSKTWGLLNYYLQSSVDLNESRRQYNLVEKRCKRIPKFIPKKTSSTTESPPDLLLGYLQELCLPIVWIIGPPTKRTIHKRKKFSQQLAKSLNFSYVNLDDKIQEWKERQASCAYEGEQQYLPPNRDLAATRVAATKLPTNVPLMCSSNLPCPPTTLNNTLDPAFVRIIESERVVFDTAVPIERNKILELYKLAMIESLPCNGFLFDTVPFDLVEGLTFEKVFYPAALAIYFSEGVPQRKNLKPEDRRVTASTAHSENSNTKILLSPAEYLERCKEDSGNVFLRMKHLKRLGTFNIAEGEKICKQYGNKTIRVINAEDVGQDTMSFVEELVKRNLEKYEQIKNGEAQVEKIPANFNRPEPQINTKLPKSPPLPTFQSFFEVESNPEHVQPNQKPYPRSPSPISVTQFDMGGRGEIMDLVQGTNNEPPPLVPVTAHHSETSIFSLPNIFDAEYHQQYRKPMSEHSSEEEEEEEVQTNYKYNSTKNPDPDQGGAGDSTMISRPKSEELWEKIARLESKVVTLNPEETSVHSESSSLHLDIPPPPTAYSDEERNLTAAIKHALKANLRVLPLPQPVEYDYGASGDRLSDHSFNPLTDNGKKSAPSNSEDEDEDIDYDDINAWQGENGDNNNAAKQSFSYNLER